MDTEHDGDPGESPEEVDLDALIAELTAPFDDELTAGATDDRSDAPQPGDESPATGADDVDLQPDVAEAPSHGHPPSTPQASLTRREVAELLRELSSLASGERGDAGGREPRGDQPPDDDRKGRRFGRR